jgi:hypothetical protein
VNRDRRQKLERYALDTADEGTFSGDTFCFDSFVSHFIEYLELVKIIEEIFPIDLPSIVIAILLDFRPIPGYIS